MLFLYRFILLSYFLMEYNSYRSQKQDAANADKSRIYHSTHKSKKIAIIADKGIFMHVRLIFNAENYNKNTTVSCPLAIKQTHEIISFKYKQKDINILKNQYININNTKINTSLKSINTTFATNMHRLYTHRGHQNFYFCNASASHQTSNNHDVLGTDIIQGLENIHIGAGFSGNFNTSSHTHIGEMSYYTEYTIIGLENLGNTCFFNSILQMLINTPELNTLILNFVDVNNQRHCDTEDCLTCNLQNLIYEIKEKFTLENSYIETDNNVKIIYDSINNKHLFNLFGEKHKKYKIIKGSTENDLFEIGIQQDAHEVLLKMLELLCFTETKQENKNGQQHLLEENEVLVNSLLGSYITSTMFCPLCDKIRGGPNNNCFNNVLSLNLDNVHNSEVVSMKTLINNYESQERMEGFICNKCKIFNINTKITEIVTVSNILIIHLVRFFTTENVSKKLETRVFETDNICIANSNYTLMGFIYHGGSDLQSGHYMYFMNLNGVKYRFNDKEIGVNEKWDEYKEGAYIYLYRINIKIQR